MDLVRLVLLQVQDGAKPTAMANYSDDQILYHSGLVIEAGLVEGDIVLGGAGQIRGAILLKLTWKGHDFIDTAQSDGVWSKAKEKVMSAGGAWTLEILKAVLVQEAKRALGLALDA
jgi:hypothetical protein